MSLPRELSDELLSAYMDGELSSDERAHVERVLAADAEARQSLRLLQEQSQALRHSLRSASSLDSAFAERVLEATFAEAQRQSLDASHPVQKAAAQRSLSNGPTVRRADTPAHSAGLGSRHWIAGLAIAAGLALAAVFYFGPGDEPPLAFGDLQSDSQNQSDSLNQSGPSSPAGERGTPPLRPNVLDDAAPETGTRLPDAQAGSAVAEPVSPTESKLAVSEPDSSRPDAIAANDREVSLTDEESPQRVAERMAERTPPAEAPADRVPSDQVALRAVLVYEVNLTPLGRERNVINRAFREAQIRTADQREIDEALVGYLRSGGVIGAVEDDQAAEGSAGDDAGVSVLFLEGSGRRLEKLMMILLAATEEVHSVGFSLAMDPPVMAAVDSLQKVDPTKIRGDSASVMAQPLIPDGARGFTAGSRSFVPLHRDAFPGMAGIVGVTSDEQPDITAMTFLVIRTHPGE